MRNTTTKALPTVTLLIAMLSCTADYASGFAQLLQVSEKLGSLLEISLLFADVILPALFILVSASIILGQMLIIAFLLSKIVREK